MSWLFGLRKESNVSGVPPVELGGSEGGNGQQPPSQQQQAAGPKPASSEAYRFDSSALERAAQAAKDLEKSS